MNLYLLRHADAEDSAKSGKDADRALSAKGREVMEVVATGFAKIGKAQAIWHSPLRRAKETAEFIAARFPKAAMTVTAALAPNADPRKILVELSRDRWEDVVIVGHMPHLGLLLGLAVTGREEIDVPMKKSAIARISFDGSHPSPPGDLKWLISPSLAQRIK
jgi:phosphohistidine phosphatase